MTYVTLLYPLSLVLLSSLYDLHYHNVAPYMDEIFHIPQAQHYCQGHFFHWDPKITTFPGLYLYTAAVQKILVGSVCSVDFLRKTNGFLAIVSFMVYFLCRKRINCPGNVDAFLISMLLFLYPINPFYYPLFYTDTASTLSICTVYLFSLLSDNGWFWHILLVMISSISVLMRQTNAVWLLFIAGTSMISPLYTQQWLRLPMHDVSFSQLFEFIKALLYNIPSLLRHTWSLLLPVGLFIVFVINNDGHIVVGDQQHHRPVLHWAMPFHLFVCHTLVLFPEFLIDVWMCAQTWLHRCGILTTGGHDEPSSHPPPLHGTTTTTSITNLISSGSPPRSPPRSPTSKGVSSSSSYNPKKKDLLLAKFTSSKHTTTRFPTTPSASSSTASSPTASTSTVAMTTSTTKKIARSLSFTHVVVSTPIMMHIVGLTVISYVLWFHCLSHPFLLADNRYVRIIILIMFPLRSHLRTLYLMYIVS